MNWWQDFADTLPEKPPKGADARIPHQGMPRDIQADLKSRGYAPTDIRFLEGEDSVLLTIKGGILGTVQIDQTKVQALRLAASVHGLMDKDRKRDSGETTYRDLDTLLGDLATSVTAPPKGIKSWQKGGGSSEGSGGGPRLAHSTNKAAERIVAEHDVSLETAINELLGEE